MYLGGIHTLWVVKVGGDDGELRSWHYIYVFSIERRLIMRVRYDTLSLSIMRALSITSLDTSKWAKVYEGLGRAH